MARAGFEWLVIDMEHAPIGIEAAARLIRVIDLAGLPALCRLPANDATLAKNVLDAGAAGIIVPAIESGEEARQAAEMAYYPPKGSRGVGLWRAQGYGSGFEAYRSRLEERIVVIAMIETRAGVQHIREVAKTSGIDGLLIGPYDISGSLGCIGQLDHPEVLAAEQRVIEAAAEAGIACGLHVVNPTEGAIRKGVEEGYTFLALGVDMILLAQAAKQVLRIASGNNSLA